MIMDCVRRARHAPEPEKAGWGVRYHHGMENPLVLASVSPRRRRLLAWLEAPYSCVATDTDEDITSALRRVPPVLARTLAADKARAARADAPADATGTVLAFDTIVVLDREVLGKPTDRADAECMLRALSGRTHTVVTGVAVLTPDAEEPQTFAVSTPVEMREIDEAAISAWLDGDEALGCAGAYNIEAHLATVGDGECYQNVAGLPLCHVYDMLARLGVSVTPPGGACESARGISCPLGRRLCATPVR